MPMPFSSSIIAFGSGQYSQVELPVALVGPVEEVGHDHRDGQVAPLVLAGYLEQLVLGPVAQLALPEAHGELGHHRHGAGGAGIGLFDLGRGVAGGDPVVEDVGRLRVPLGDILAKGRLADGGVVPEEAVAQAGEHEGHAGLRVAVGQLERAALDVEVRLLVLAHAEQLFGRDRIRSGPSAGNRRPGWG